MVFSFIVSYPHNGNSFLEITAVYFLNIQDSENSSTASISSKLFSSSSIGRLLYPEIVSLIMIGDYVTADVMFRNLLFLGVVQRVYSLTILPGSALKVYTKDKERMSRHGLYL